MQPKDRYHIVTLPGDGVGPLRTGDLVRWTTRGDHSTPRWSYKAACIHPPNLQR